MSLLDAGGVETASETKATQTVIGEETGRPTTFTACLYLEVSLP